MTMTAFRKLAIASTAMLIVSPALAEPINETFETESGSIQVETVTEGIAEPWGLALLPDESWLVTEKEGNLRMISSDGALSDPISGTPEVDARDQGGLLDVTIDPDFEENRMVYLSFSEPGENDTNSTAVYKARLSDDGTALEDGEVIFSQQPKEVSTKHYGSRIVFDGDGHLFVTLGERSDAEFRGQAQDLDSHLGKIVRINPDGSVPEDNPFVDDAEALPEIWSYGNRNVQAAAMNPETGDLWEIEHGPMGGDELNIIQPGNNYGWPLVSHGVEYSGDPINEGEAAMEGGTDAILTWTPVIAPSGMIFYDGEAFPEWQGDIFVGGLASAALVHVDVEGESAEEKARYLEDLGMRIQDVAQGPEGAIYVVTDDTNGHLLRIMPAD
ncbi:PQQ-dependent sugar dehydrogenase [Pararhizobium haloflavum]|uniref:PQQ-dependent sugar dehydrogenase n=1 Tax=Pararhizobium haloflavum TaxID=2037914 RepID=UPI000C19FA45|nr:PQQ-dependent sugar dehydrogenase [Pararhizobium haloflavum]